MKRTHNHSLPATTALAAVLVGIAVLMLGILPAAPKAVPEVDNAVVFVVDMSTSLSPEEKSIVRKGHAVAIASNEVVSAILQGARQQSAFAYVEFADTAVTVVDWTLIDGPDAAASFAAAILAPERRQPNGTSTGIGEGLKAAYGLLMALPFKADQRTVDVVGDGANNAGIQVATPRMLILESGATINGIPVTLSPDPGVVAYYRDQVIGGPRAFMVEVQSIGDLPMAIRRKLIQELW